MFNPSQLNSSLHEQLSIAFTAAHRAAFEDADSSGLRPDPMLSVPVRLIPLVQAARALRRAVELESDVRAMLQALLDLSDEALLAMDGRRKVIFANAAARRVLLLGEPFCRDADCLHLADREADRRLECALRTGTLGTGDEATPGIARLVRLGQLSSRSYLLLVLRRQHDTAPACALGTR
ncbi:MAG: PAS domain-containing protein [Gammaproteobacteria bacterium]